MYALDSFEDVQMRLDGTIALYNGVPVYVSAPLRRGSTSETVNTVMITSIHDKGKSINKTISSMDKDFSVSGFRQGFVNSPPSKKTPPYTGYLRRMPLRQQKQALSPASCSMTLLSAGYTRTSALYIEDIPGHVGLADMLRGTYPTWQHVLAKVQEFAMQGSSMAFANDWAVMSTGSVKQIDLWYQLQRVGRYSDKRKKFLVSVDIPGMSFVLPELETLGLPHVIE